MICYRQIANPRKINTQIDVSAEELRKFENSQENQEVPDQFYEGVVDILTDGEMMEDPLPERGDDITERAERPKKKRREKAKPLEDGLDLSGEFPRENTLRPRLGNTTEAHLAVLGNS